MDAFFFFFFWLNFYVGMLSSTETIHMIAETLETHKVPTIVLDPVCSFSLESSLYNHIY